MDKGGLLALNKWLIDHKSARLVVIDTWPKFRPGKTPGANEYESDYQAAAELKAVADKYAVAIWALCHCRKLAAADPMDEVSGTLGLSGAADAVAVMRRERGRSDASLHLTGRDIEEREIALRWTAEYALWEMIGDAEEYRLSQERQQVIDLLIRTGELGPTQVADLLDRKASATRKLLWTMAQQGQLVSSGGKYSIGNPGNLGNLVTTPTTQPSDPVTTVTGVTDGEREEVAEWTA
jgi:hypothetical protein